MRIITWIITIPIAVLAVLFAISNRETVTFALWPTPFTLEAPLYLATLVALVVGFLAGGLIAWLNQGHYRRKARVESDRAYFLERELKESQARTALAEKRLAELSPPVSGQPRPPAATVPVPVEPGQRAPAVH